VATPARASCRFLRRVMSFASVRLKLSCILLSKNTVGPPICEIKLGSWYDFKIDGSPHPDLGVVLRVYSTVENPNYYFFETCVT